MYLGSSSSALSDADYAARRSSGPGLRPPKNPPSPKHSLSVTAGLVSLLVSLPVSLLASLCLLCSTTPCPLPRLLLSLLPFCSPLPSGKPSPSLASPALLLPLSLSLCSSATPDPFLSPSPSCDPPRYVPVNPPTTVSVSSRLLASSLRHSTFLCFILTSGLSHSAHAFASPPSPWVSLSRGCSIDYGVGRRCES